MVWYHIEKDSIFLSSWLDVHFYGLHGGIRWDMVEVLGEF